MRAISNWNWIRTALALAETGSFRSAGEKLGVSGATVSRHLEELEEEIGHPLFVLKSGRWTPTLEGQDLIGIAREHQLKLGLFYRENQPAAKGTGELQVSSLSFINQFFLSRALGKWREHSNDLTLEISASDENSGVETGEVDIAIRLAKPTIIGVSRFKITDCPMSLYSSGDLNEKRWVGLPKSLDHLPEMQMAHSFFGRAPILRIDSYSAIAYACLSTGLPGVIPTCITEVAGDFRDLKVIPGSPSVTRSLWFVYHERRKQDPSIAAFKRFVKSVFPKNAYCSCGKCDLEQQS